MKFLTLVSLFTFGIEGVVLETSDQLSGDILETSSLGYSMWSDSGIFGKSFGGHGSGLVDWWDIINHKGERSRIPRMRAVLSGQGAGDIIYDRYSPTYDDIHTHKSCSHTGIHLCGGKEPREELGPVIVADLSVKRVTPKINLSVEVFPSSFGEMDAELSSKRHFSSSVSLMDAPNISKIYPEKYIPSPDKTTETIDVDDVMPIPEIITKPENPTPEIINIQIPRPENLSKIEIFSEPDEFSKTTHFSSKRPGVIVTNDVAVIPEITVMTASFSEVFPNESDQNNVTFTPCVTSNLV